MDNIILWIMAIAMVLGALDRMFGSRLGLGKQFEEGILAIGALSLSMLGILTLAPVLARLLRPVLVPVYGFLGADPAMFAGSILANDMGGAPLAMELAGTRAAGQLGGLIVGSMLGATVVFSIPVALGILQPEDRPALARGVLAGLLAIAPGAFAGGLAAGFPLGMLVRNLVPIVLFAVLIALGLWRWERAMIRGFLWFGRGVLAVITVGLAAAVFTELTGVTVIPGMAPLEGGVQTVAGIGFVLAGAFPLVFLLTKLLRRRARGEPCKLHPHVRHGEGHGRARQDREHRLRRPGGLRLRRPPRLHGRLRRGHARPRHRGQAHGRRPRRPRRAAVHAEKARAKHVTRRDSPARRRT